jgi:OmpA-OmpF porin, OOP family
LRWRRATSDLGKSRFTTQTSPAGTLTGETSVQGASIDLVGKAPFTDKFSGLARVGFQQAWSKDRFRGTGAGAGVDYTSKHDDPSFKVGLGMQYEITPAIWIRGELDRYRIKDVTGRRKNVDVASASLVFPFGSPGTPAGDTGRAGVRGARPCADAAAGGRDPRAGSRSRSAAAAGRTPS